MDGIPFITHCTTLYEIKKCNVFYLKGDINLSFSRRDMFRNKYVLTPEKYATITICGTNWMFLPDPITALGETICIFGVSIRPPQLDNNS